MSDPADLNDRLLQAVLKAEPASQIMFDVANGDDQTEVPTLSGPIPSLAKWLKDKGNALVDSAAALQDYAALRAYTGPLSIVRIIKPGISGFFQHRAGDTTSADNAGTLIVDTLGRRWRRQYEGPVYATWFGLVGGVGVDETGTILTTIEAMPAGGQLIIAAQNPGDPIYLNRPLPVETSHFTLEFHSPILCGPNEMIRINGGLLEVKRPGMVNDNLALRSASTVDAEGRMVLPLRAGEGAFLQLDDKIVVRGENDRYGKAFTKQVTTVIAINGDDITCADEPDETFLPAYPGSEWPSDWTTGTTISIAAFSALTVDVAPGERPHMVTVASTDVFAVGQLCYISDARTEADMMAPVASNLRSACNMEIARIVALDPVAKTLTFDRHLERDFPIAWGAGVAVMAPVVNSHIILRAGMSWAAPQPNRRNSALAINYGDRCTIQADLIDGIAGRIGAAVRVGYSYDCHIINARVRDAYRFESAEGYGLTLYYSTLCSIKHSHATGCRHNYLVQTGTLNEIAHNYSGDDFISGIDVHGANSVKTWIHHNTVTRSNRHSPGVTNGGGIRNGNTSHIIGDHDTVIEDNWISGYLGALHAALDVSPSSRDTVLRKNTIQDVQIAFRHYKVNTSNPNQHANRVEFSDNLVIRAVEPLDVENYDGNSYWDELILKRNTFRECGPVVVWDLPKLICKGNDVEDMAYVPGQHAFEFRGIGDLRMQGCSADGAARGVIVTNCAKAALVRNWLGETVEGIPITDGGGNGQLILLDNDNGLPPTTIIDGGEFEAATTTVIDGGDFDAATGTIYDGGTF
ncbi:hypothetical protein [Azotobacter chroococcum]|uniref:Uncharacterized protein n=1 Tax=Azotobacter chroococcum TaxID=353 RepID=A0AAP9Y8S3_9GAMM|nr:hypothetical protein [Azotobacter chroococcum]QQE86911.1 hypothetical protein GKQ51_11220 [Azotobacter chroococcum]